MPDQFFVTFKNRGQITVTGNDAFDFLQSIISNDLNLLKETDNIHACLLSPQGKFLHDFFASQTENGYILECEGGERTNDLLKRLSLYKLRSDVTLTAKENVIIYATGTSRTTTKPNGQEKPFEEWDKERILHGEPDGSRDAEIGFSTLAELNLDQTTVSYTKGCYVGQELVARMHNRNLGKKHLVPARFKTTPPPRDSEIENYGIMRSSCENVGLILMNRETEQTIRETQHDDSEIYLLGL